MELVREINNESEFVSPCLLESQYFVVSSAEREMVWSQIASAAETGWDFSTRWFSQEGHDR